MGLFAVKAVSLNTFLNSFVKKTCSHFWSQHILSLTVLFTIWHHSKGNISTLIRASLQFWTQKNTHCWKNIPYYYKSFFLKFSYSMVLLSKLHETWQPEMLLTKYLPYSRRWIEHHCCSCRTHTVAHHPEHKESYWFSISTGGIILVHKVTFHLNRRNYTGPYSGSPPQQEESYCFIEWRSTSTGGIILVRTVAFHLNRRNHIGSYSGMPHQQEESYWSIQWIPTSPGWFMLVHSVVFHLNRRNQISSLSGFPPQQKLSYRFIQWLSTSTKGIIAVHMQFSISTGWIILVHIVALHLNWSNIISCTVALLPQTRTILSDYSVALHLKRRSYWFLQFLAS